MPTAKLLLVGLLENVKIVLLNQTCSPFHKQEMEVVFACLSPFLVISTQCSKCSATGARSILCEFVLILFLKASNPVTVTMLCDDGLCYLIMPRANSMKKCAKVSSLCHSQKSYASRTWSLFRPCHLSAWVCVWERYLHQRVTTAAAMKL